MGCYLGLGPLGNIKKQITMLERLLTYDLSCYRIAVYILFEFSDIKSSLNKLEADSHEF